MRPPALPSPHPTRLLLAQFHVPPTAACHRHTLPCTTVDVDATLAGSAAVNLHHIEFATFSPPNATPRRELVRIPVTQSPHFAAQIPTHSFVQAFEFAFLPTQCSSRSSAVSLLHHGVPQPAAFMFPQLLVGAVASGMYRAAQCACMAGAPTSAWCTHAETALQTVLSCRADDDGSVEEAPRMEDL